MDIEIFRNYCLHKAGTKEEFPFGEETLVFKVAGKMFALAGLGDFPLRISLKCDPERAIALREEHPDHILGAYHMNKKHWNSLILEDLKPELVLELIDHSYDLVIAGLTKKEKQQLIKI